MDSRDDELATLRARVAELEAERADMVADGDAALEQLVNAVAEVQRLLDLFDSELQEASRWLDESPNDAYRAGYRGAMQTIWNRSRNIARAALAVSGTTGGG